VVSSEQRRKQLAREKYLRQQQRRVQARRKGRIRIAVIATAVVVVLGSVGAFAAFDNSSKNAKSDNAADQATPTPSKAPDPCDKPAKGKPNGKKWKKEPKLTVDKSATYTMTMHTTCGDIDVTMDAGATPHTVNSFAFLAKENFFDHTPCHRLTTQGIYVLQCGDPTGTGSGSPGYTIPDENLDAKSVKGGTYPAGTVAMANTGQKDTGGSQFFLVYKDSPLPPKYTPFGTISDAGMKVLKKIAKAGAGGMQGQKPNATVVIDDMKVTKD
jgi:peptidyl-prolyl cis-trans isomerase B (cyclophilin B)